MKKTPGPKKGTESGWEKYWTDRIKKEIEEHRPQIQREAPEKIQASEKEPFRKLVDPSNTSQLAKSLLIELEENGKMKPTSSRPDSSLSNVPPSWPRTAGYGNQPSSVAMDHESVELLRSHRLLEVLREVSTMEENRGTGCPEDMTISELIKFRTESPIEWDRLSKQRMVESFSLCKATAEDHRFAKQTAYKTRGKKLKTLIFDDTIDVARVPVGKDFQPKEKVKRTKEKIKRESKKP